MNIFNGKLSYFYVDRGLKDQHLIVSAIRQLTTNQPLKPFVKNVYNSLIA